MTYQLTIEPLGATVSVADGQTLLDAALRSGIGLPYACNHGLCGTCKVDVLEGDVRHNHASAFALMDLERDEGKCLACCATLASDVVIEADVDVDPDARALPIRDYCATVQRIEMLTPTIRGIWLAVDEAVDFQAGQYVNLNVPGLAAPRAFSIASPPSATRELELNVRLVADGVGTRWLHEELRVGDRLAFTAPLGRFFVRKSAPAPIVFLAGGSGLSSPKSMIVDLIEQGDARAITLVHGARTADELYYREFFTGLAARHANFDYHPVLSDAVDDATWNGARGFVHEQAARVFDGRFAGRKAYLCGPPAMVDACVTTLMQGRLFEADIYTESFLTAADGAAPPRRSALFRKF